MSNRLPVQNEVYQFIKGKIILTKALDILRSYNLKQHKDGVRAIQSRLDEMIRDIDDAFFDKYYMCHDVDICNQQFKEGE